MFKERIKINKQLLFLKTALAVRSFSAFYIREKCLKSRNHDKKISNKVTSIDLSTIYRLSGELHRK